MIRQRKKKSRQPCVYCPGSISCAFGTVCFQLSSSQLTGQLNILQQHKQLRKPCCSLTHRTFGGCSGKYKALHILHYSSLLPAPHSALPHCKLFTGLLFGIMGFIAAFPTGFMTWLFFGCFPWIVVRCTACRSRCLKHLRAVTCPW